MKASMRLKAVMKSVSREKRISAQLALQNYMLERLLERISLPDYRSNFVLKGGLLISALAGLAARTTMDMDGTVRRMPVSAASMKRMFRKICAVPVEDGVSFSVGGVEEIRENEEYSGIRLSLTAHCFPMKVPLKVDVTSGDRITPRAVAFDYPVLLEPRSIRVWAYNPETVMAEKLETVLSRGDLNTRMRDFYDIWILQRLPGRRLRMDILRKALRATAAKRGSLDLLALHAEIMRAIGSSSQMDARWKNYRRDLEYAGRLEFKTVCRAATAVLNQIFGGQST